jgi:hypothetical protein
MLAKPTTEPVVINPDAFVKDLRARSYWLRRIERLQLAARRRNGLGPTRWYARGTHTLNIRMCIECLAGTHLCDHKRPCSCICRGELAPLLRLEERG